MPKKRRARGVLGNKHRASKEEAMKWFQQKVSVTDMTGDESTQLSFAVMCTCTLLDVFLS